MQISSILRDPTFKTGNFVNFCCYYCIINSIKVNLNPLMAFHHYANTLVASPLLHVQCLKSQLPTAALKCVNTCMTE